MGNDLLKLLRKLKRMDSNAWRMMQRYEKAGSLEAMKMSMGQSYGFRRAAQWLEEILKPKQKGGAR